MDEAAFFVKDWMEPTIFSSVHEANQVNRDIKLILSGGEALHAYFERGPPIFSTPDFDFKVVLKKTYPLLDENVSLMHQYAEAVIRILQKRLNRKFLETQSWGQDQLTTRFGVEMVPAQDVEDAEDEKGYFGTFRPGDEYLYTIRYWLKDPNTGKTASKSLLDLYVAVPGSVDRFPEDNYIKFLGGNPELSWEEDVYYIPVQEIDQILYAGLGYVIWDTFRMMLNTKIKEHPKFERYRSKWWALIHDLNHPEKRLSCHLMQHYIRQCQDQLDICAWKESKFSDPQEILDYGREQGFFSEEEVERLQKQKFSLSYLCEYLSKIDK